MTISAAVNDTIKDKPQPLMLNKSKEAEHVIINANHGEVGRLRRRSVLAQLDLETRKRIR